MNQIELKNWYAALSAEYRDTMSWDQLSQLQYRLYGERSLRIIGIAMIIQSETRKPITPSHVVAVVYYRIRLLRQSGMSFDGALDSLENRRLKPIEDSRLALIAQEQTVEDCADNVISVMELGQWMDSLSDKDKTAFRYYIDLLCKSGKTNLQQIDRACVNRASYIVKRSFNCSLNDFVEVYLRLTA